MISYYHQKMVVAAMKQETFTDIEYSFRKKTSVENF